MIYITGDVHGELEIGSRLRVKNFPEQKEMTENDFVLVAGDFGLIWDRGKTDKYWLKWLNESKKFTTLFIDGNHENHDLLDAYPVEEWNGGKVHKISDKIIHLMRGQVFEIDNHRLFTFGGAASHDKDSRVEGRSWWSREMPSQSEYEEGIRNLEKVNYEVDYIITHTCSMNTLGRVNSEYGLDHEVDPMHKYFQQIEDQVAYKHWFFGHFHHDQEFPKSQRLLYRDILRLV